MALLLRKQRSAVFPIGRLCCLHKIVKMASAMDIDDEEIELPTSSSGKGEKKRFEVKKVIIDLFQLLLFLNAFAQNH